MTLNTVKKSSGAKDEEVMSSLALSLAGVNIEGAQGTSTRTFGDIHSNGGTASGGLIRSTGYDWKGTGFSSFTDNLPTARPSTPDQRTRGESIDLFLSQSPSQTLGNNLLSLGSQEPSAKTQGCGLSSAPYGLMSQASHVGRRDASPAGSVAGTSASTGSRSQSPSQLQPHFHGQHLRGNIPASSSAFEHEVGLSGRRSTSHASLASAEDTYDGRPHRMQVNHQASGQNLCGGPYAHTAGAHAPIIEQHFDVVNGLTPAPMPFPIHHSLEHGGYQSMHPNQSQQQQQQVFYMAVATHDGRQVLQPVQVLQIPGQPSPAVVVPTGMALNAAQLSHQPPIQGATPTSQTMPSTGPQAELSTPNSKSYGTRRLKSNIHSHPNSHGQRVSSSSSTSKSHLRYSDRKQGKKDMSEENDFDHDNDVSGYDTARLYPNEINTGNSLQLANESYSRRSTPSNSRGPSPQSSTAPNDAIATLYAAPQRPPLDELLGNVRRLSRDQVGCRLLQQALDEEGPMAATMILEEGLSFWGEAMVDPFGNYLFQKILEKITPEERVVLVRSVSVRLVNASLNLHGTRSVQKVVELCAADEPTMAAKGQMDPPETSASILTRALTPAAARLCIDSHGNHVIQRILLKLPQHHSHFVFEAVATSVGDVARHRHGCCVIQRCLDSPPSEARSHLVDRIVEKALELMQDAYGNYVVQYVLDVCGDKDVHVVCDRVVGRVNSLAVQKFSSNVVEKCLERCTDKMREQYLDELSDPDRIRELMMDPFGNYVIQRALSVATHSQATRLVDAIKPHLLSSQQGGQSCAGLRNTAGGRRILAKICRRFPNFSLQVSEDQHQIYEAPHSYRQNTHLLRSPMRMGQKSLSVPPHLARQQSGGYHAYQHSP
mmetsp:Transcript_8113/g.17549  ORF Transcript_8113/g.17549 Transcript_8113/m.17549 type:complete len:884 (+) Transcript_8113:377-3028(+)|eukprot:CAMPEP_0178507426 /NCGR_PEP_ID=MMETSP0696-20121128/20209_1 /TAXON_ID=265572 /ORGANISM="Extubocellulus spinifer, Strain CCMP396" /LENGTH=883 /DNA_ID=CAMNT_0020136905 /DNA_START=286 /DNA_END=2937 /DNA_ORIENTATION=+